MIPAIVIARGGSKRLFRKNVLTFCGHPLVAWSIIQARYCKYIDDVWLSTDDDEIAETGKEYGAHIIRRPDWPDADILSATKPFMHAIEEIKKQYNFEIHLHVLPTSPCVHPEDLNGLFEKYYKIEKVNPSIKGMLCLSEQREMLVYKALENDFAVPWLASKTFDYLTQGPSRNIAKTEKWLKSVEISLEQKKGSLIDIHGGLESYRTFSQSIDYYYICKWYQQYDIDDQETFDLNELLMNQYILKGRGIEIYKEYAEGEKWKN